MRIIDTDYKSALAVEIIEPSIGLSMLLSNKTALNFSIGYEIQQLGEAIIFIPGGGSVSKAVSINLGVSF